MTYQLQSDPTLQVGDAVFSTYTKGELLFRITEIEKRYLTKEDLRYGVYKDANEGDEFEPIITIVSVANLGLLASRKKFRKTTQTVDATYLVRAKPQDIQDHIKKLNDLLLELWP